MLRKQHFDQFLVGATCLAHFWKHVLLLEYPLVVVLAELAKQPGSVNECAQVEVQSSSLEARSELTIDNERSPQHPVLAHQVLGGGDLIVAGGIGPEVRAHARANRHCATSTSGRIRGVTQAC
jgi:hypothetical protein